MEDAIEADLSAIIDKSTVYQQKRAKFVECGLTSCQSIVDASDSLLIALVGGPFIGKLKSEAAKVLNSKKSPTSVGPRSMFNTSIIGDNSTVHNIAGDHYVNYTTSVPEDETESILEATSRCDPVFASMLWLQEMQTAAKSVCAVVAGEQARGTAFLVGEKCEWILTNMHVLCEKSYPKHGEKWLEKGSYDEALRAKFKEELSKNGENFRFRFDYDAHPCSSAEDWMMAMDPENDWVLIPELDVALIRVIKPSNSSVPRTPLKLSRRLFDSEKSRNQTRCYIIGHPKQGEDFSKRLSVQSHNYMVGIKPSSKVRLVLHYLTDTLKGCSGSPVLEWNVDEQRLEVIAVHHTGKFMIDRRGFLDVNEYEEVLQKKLKKDNIMGYNEGSLIEAILPYIEGKI